MVLLLFYLNFDCRKRLNEKELNKKQFVEGIKGT